MATPTYPCFICGRETLHGDHKYYGKPLPYLQIYVCHGCLDANHDGLADDSVVNKIYAHLDAKGIARPEPNENGYMVLR